MTTNQQHGLTARWLWAVFLLVAGYSLVAGVLVQTVIAPRLENNSIPAGLIPGLDTVGFHQMAVEMAEDIEVEGWSAWEWDPGWSANQPVGIMAAVYAVFGVTPLFLLPFNALVHGFSAVLLFLIFRSCGFRSRESFAGTLPFAFFPSTLTWVAQFHKDGIYCLGLFAMSLGCLWILSGSGWRRRLAGVGWIVVGGLVASLMRGYGITLFIVAASASATFCVMVALLQPKRRNLGEGIGLAVLLGALALLLPLAGSKGGEVSAAAEDDAIAVAENPSSAPVGAEATHPQGSIATAENPSREVFVPGENYTPPATPWKTTAWLPGPVDRAFHRLIHNRTVYLWMFPDAGSFVDEDRSFSNVKEVIFYLPRATVIGLFAPFPNMWFGEAVSPTGGIQRRVAAVETLVAYVLLAGALIGLLRWPRLETFFLAGVALLLILVLVYPIPAVGTLFRLRFGPFAFLLGIGAATLVRIFLNHRAERQQ